MATRSTLHVEGWQPAGHPNIRLAFFLESYFSHLLSLSSTFCLSFCYSPLCFPRISHLLLQRHTRTRVVASSLEPAASSFACNHSLSTQTANISLGRPGLAGIQQSTIKHRLFVPRKFLSVIIEGIHSLGFGVLKRCITVTPPVEQIKTGSEPQNTRRGALLSFLRIAKLHILPDKNKLSKQKAGTFRMKMSTRCRGAGETRTVETKEADSAVPPASKYPIVNICRGGICLHDDQSLPSGPVAGRAHVEQ